MAAPSPRLLLLAVALVTCLALQRGEASGLRRLGFAAEWSRRTLHGADAVVLMVAPPPAASPAPAGLSFDLDHACKRRVRRGSDPIHNRC
ncbi:unnamed protein product [Spirodela intermedia]|uniref:Uncharacterized protein n=1 Tax=Spirodela intermedia TaxID=51605 RepID=A0A7I8KFY1_SPIIN|nr:unnamed protein product [Spirodela intermedia]